MFLRFRRASRKPAPQLRPQGAKRRFNYVTSLIEGTLAPTAEHPSMLFFTAHKCASAFVGEMLWQIAASQSIIPIDLDGLAANATKRTPAEELAIKFSEFGGKNRTQLARDEVRTMREFFKPRGFFYGPFRHPHLVERLPDLREHKTLLMLRDPRDTLTSRYYSVAYSHRPPGNPDRLGRFLKGREQARRTGIDEYVLKNTRSEVAKYSLYCDVLLPRENVLLVKYEDMVADFAGWLNQVLYFWGLDLDRRLIKTLVDGTDFEVQSEDVHSHKRQVTPGDHRRKLKPATIERLDEEFGDVLDRLGYSRDVATSRAA